MIFGMEFRWKRVGSWDGQDATLIRGVPHVLQHRLRVSPIYAGADGNVHVSVSDAPEWTEWKTVEVSE